MPKEYCLIDDFELNPITFFNATLRLRNCRTVKWSKQDLSNSEYICAGFVRAKNLGLHFSLLTTNVAYVCIKFFLKIFLDRFCSAFHFHSSNFWLAYDSLVIRQICMPGNLIPTDVPRLNLEFLSMHLVIFLHFLFSVLA